MKKSKRTTLIALTASLFVINLFIQLPPAWARISNRISLDPGCCTFLAGF